MKHPLTPYKGKVPGIAAHDADGVEVGNSALVLVATALNEDKKSLQERLHNALHDDAPLKSKDEIILLRESIKNQWIQNGRVTSATIIEALVFLLSDAARRKGETE